MPSGRARLAAELAGATQPGNRPDCWCEPGVVTTVITGYLADPADAVVTVTWRNTVVPVSYVSSYTPVEGDVVLLLIQPPSVIVLGRIVGPGG